MTKVVVKEYRGPKRLTLTKERTREFDQELRRVKRASPRGKARPYGIAPDCEVMVTSATGKKTVYQLYGRSVLIDKRSGASWQFYFGLLLLKWLQI